MQDLNAAFRALAIAMLTGQIQITKDERIQMQAAWYAQGLSTAQVRDNLRTLGKWSIKKASEYMDNNYPYPKIQRALSKARRSIKDKPS